MIRRGALLALLALLAAGCGVRPSGVVTGLEAPSGPPEGAELSLYLVAGDGLVPVRRAVGPPTGTDLVAALAAGPSAAERARGLGTEVPTAAAPAVVERSTDGFAVTLATDVDLLSATAVDQIVCTVLAGQQVSRTVLLTGGGNSIDGLTCAW